VNTKEEGRAVLKKNGEERKRKDWGSFGGGERKRERHPPPKSKTAHSKLGQGGG